MLKKISISISKYFFLITFLGFFGSVTFFNHSHILNGITIVHSHPYKSSSGDVPVKHNHPGNGFVLIQFICGFIATASVLFIVAAVFRRILNVFLPLFDENIRLNLNIYTANRPRGPTLLLHKQFI